MVCRAYSKGLLSTWFYAESYNLLIDCGDGANIHLFHKLGSIKFIAITHEHFDHISGLISLLNTRNRVSPNSKITIFLPSRHERFDFIFSILGKNVLDNINIIYVEEGKEYQLDKKRFIRAFKTHHGANSVGYHVIEYRGKLKKEFSTLTGRELSRLDKDTITEKIEHSLLTFVGDSGPHVKEYDLIYKPDILVLESTFLSKHERLLNQSEVHLDLDYVFDIIPKINPKKSIIIHLSPRYANNEIEQSFVRKLGKWFKKDIDYVFGYKELDLSKK